MTYNPPTAQVTQQKDVTYGNIQPTTKAKNKKMEPSGKKTSVIINPSKKDIQEKSVMSFTDFCNLDEGDYWHPDPEKDRKLSNRGAKLRAREDQESKSKPSVSSRKLRPGESYMDYAKRHGHKSSPKKEGLKDKLKRKLGLKNSFDPEGEFLESAVPGKPAERLGAVTAIPADEREAARQRILAKTAAKRKEREMKKEEFEIEEGMTMKDFKANRKKLQRKAASADAEKRGHVGKEWHNTGRKYSPDEAKRNRANMSDAERSSRHRMAVDPDSEHDNYSADKTKNPKKLRKQKAMGESMSFLDFVESRRMDREGVDRGDSRRAERAAKAKASLAAVKKGEERKVKVAKKYGIEPSKADTVEKKAHKQNHPGSRQTPKVKGAKETSSETQNRRASRHNQRVIKHGFTSKEKRENQAMQKWHSARD